MVVVAGDVGHGPGPHRAALPVIGSSAGKVKSPSIVFVRPRPDRIDRLPEQYFARLLARVADAAALEGDAVVDLGRGNPDIGPPQHVIDAAARAANDHSAHGYPPFRGIPELKEAIADRYRDVYGVELDPEREVAVVPGTKTAIVEVAMCLAERGETILLPDPGYPDYTSGVALARGARGAGAARPGGGLRAGAPRAEGAAALYLNYPSNPCAASAPRESSRRPCAGRSGRARSSSTTSPMPTSSSTDGGRRASSPSRARGRSARRCSPCRRPTAWPAGGSASSSGTPSWSSGSTCWETTCAPASSGRSRRRASPR